MSIQVNINGNKDTITQELTVAQLLTEKEVESPEMVSVELNGEFVERKSFSDTVIKAGDEIEFLYFMGGGA